MIYMTGTIDGQEMAIVVLETESLERLKKGEPAKTPDGKILICWTPDIDWLAGKLQDTAGGGADVARLIEESAKRPQAAARPYHGYRKVEFERFAKDITAKAANLDAELEATADKLSDCWLLLDEIARNAPKMTIARAACEALLRKQQAPGWKS
jgi:hypothetical protein